MALSADSLQEVLLQVDDLLKTETVRARHVRLLRLRESILALGARACDTE